MMKKQMFPLILLLSLTAGKVSANSFFERLSENPFSDCSIEHVEEVVTDVETETIVNPFHVDPFSDCSLDQTETVVFEDQEEDSDVQTGWGECDALDIYLPAKQKAIEMVKVLAEKTSDLYTKASEKASEIYASKVAKKSEEVETSVTTEPIVLVETVEVAPVVETVEAQEVAPVVVDSAKVFEDVTNILKEFPTECSTSYRTKKTVDQVTMPEVEKVELKDDAVVSTPKQINSFQDEVDGIIEDVYKLATMAPSIAQDVKSTVINTTTDTVSKTVRVAKDTVDRTSQTVKSTATATAQKVQDAATATEEYIASPEGKTNIIVGFVAAGVAMILTELIK